MLQIYFRLGMILLSWKHPGLSLEHIQEFRKDRWFAQGADQGEMDDEGARFYWKKDVGVAWKWYTMFIFTP